MSEYPNVENKPEPYTHRQKYEMFFFGVFVLLMVISMKSALIFMLLVCIGLLGRDLV